MEEDKKGNVENEITDQVEINNEEVLIEEEKSNQENNVIKSDVKENENKKESSNVKSIVIILILFIILVIAGVYGLFLVSKEESNSNNEHDNNEITDNNIQEEIPTFSDDSVVHEEDDDNFEGKVLNVYQKGYAENGPIAFTYECKSEDCDIRVTDKGFILYDENNVYYREMTSYEYEQINNSEVSPFGSRLDMDGFEEISQMNDDYIMCMYKVEDSIYVVDYASKYKIMFLDDYLEYTSSDNIDNLIWNDNYIFDREKNNILFLAEQGEPEVEFYEKKGDFYIFFVHSDSSQDFWIINSQMGISKQLFYVQKPWSVGDFVKPGYFYNENMFYYIQDDKVQILNSSNENIQYNNEGIEPIHIFDDKLIYLDKDGILSVKNILDDNDIYKTDIKLENAYLVGSENGYKIFEINKSVLNDEIIKQYLKREDITIYEDIDTIKKCINDVNECKEFCYMVGNIINLDKDGKFISREYYLTPSQFCMN